MDSKAIAILIVAAGIIVLIVSGAIGIPVNDTVGLSRTGAHPGSTSGAVIVLDEGSPPAERAPDFDNGRDMACTIAITLIAIQPPDHGDCLLVDDGRGNGRCAAKLVHHCIGDYPSTDDDSPALQQTAGRTGFQAD